MKCIKGLDNCPTLDSSVVTIGNFDGMHLAHRNIISYLTQCAKDHKTHSVVVSFYTHPSSFFGSDIPILMGLREKCQFLSELEVDTLLLIHFNEKFAHLTPAEFITQILQSKLSAKAIVIGDDFRFGRYAKGDSTLLNEYIPTTTIIDTIYKNDMRVSSSNIRYALSKGDMTTANMLLGYTYFLKGRVVKGLGLGSTMGIPTANINIKNRTLALSGVYIVDIALENHIYHGVVNIGRRPTIGDNLKTSVEVHIFDFNKNIYGKVLKIILKEKIRSEQKFTCIDDLVKQIKKDITFAKTKV